MTEHIHPEVLKRLTTALTGSNSAYFRRDFKRTYQDKGEEKARHQQFLRPKLYVTVPAVELTSATGVRPHTLIPAQVTNRGGAACYNAVIKLLLKLPDGSTTEMGRQIIPTIAAGQTIKHAFHLDHTQMSLNLGQYQVVCFDPFFDPIRQDVIPSLIPKDFDLLVLTENRQHQDYWKQSPLDDGYHEVSGAAGWIYTWHYGNLPDGTFTRVTLDTSDGSPLISQMKQTVSLSQLGQAFRAVKADLVVNAHGWVSLGDNPNPAQPKLGIDFLNAAGNTIGSQFFDAARSDAQPRILHFWSVTQSIPANAASVALRLICDKRGVANAGNMTFATPSLYVTHRQVFASNSLKTGIR